MAMTAASKPGWRRRIESLARPRHPESLPVALDRRRVYILPTAFGWFFLLLLLAMLAGALNYNNNPALLLRSEAHTSELQSLMRISYAVFCLKYKIYQLKNNQQKTQPAKFT